MKLLFNSFNIITFIFLIIFNNEFIIKNNNQLINLKQKLFYLKFHKTLINIFKT